MFKNLSKKEMVTVLAMYEDYIREANRENRYQEGWCPVCLNEYVDTEYSEYLEDPEGFEVELEEQTTQLLSKLLKKQLLQVAAQYNDYLQLASDYGMFEEDVEPWFPLVLSEFIKQDPVKQLELLDEKIEAYI